jgi:hypothetical protein
MALLDPLKEVHGVSDKILMMALGRSQPRHGRVV